MKQGMPPNPSTCPRWPAAINSNTNTAVNNSGSSSSSSIAMMKEKLNVEKLISENAVIIFASRGCCMLHALRFLLHRVGLNPRVYYIDDECDDELMEDLERIIGDSNNKLKCLLKFPAVFVGGKLFGGFEHVMMAHIAGDLVPILREVRALWL